MSRLRLCTIAVAAIATAAFAASATADPNVGPTICTSGGAPTAIAGTYGNLTITGNRFVAADTTLTVHGNLTIARGACLDAFTMGTVTVGGNLQVRQGAILALGCTTNSTEPGQATPCTGTTNDTVGGNLVAVQPWTMYIDGSTIHGNLVSNGGGPGATLNPYVNYPIKDNEIDGNVNVHGWSGAWFGFIRNTTHGNVVISHDVGLTIGDLGTLDSTEVAGNTIAGNLVCQHNTPAAQFGDVPPFFDPHNQVGGHKVGECAGL